MRVLLLADRAGKFLIDARAPQAQADVQREQREFANARKSDELVGGDEGEDQAGAVGDRLAQDVPRGRQREVPREEAGTSGAAGNRD